MHSNHRPIKKLLCSAALLLVLCLLTACVRTEPLDISKINMNDLTLDVSDMAETLLSQLTFDDTLLQLEPEIAAGLFDISGLYNDIAAYGSTGATAEALVLLRCQSATDAETAEARIREYCTEMADVYADYNMKESEKLTDALIACHGRYVIFCVSPDTAAVTEAYQAYVVDSLKK